MDGLRVLFVQNRVCARTWRAAKVLADAGTPPYLLELDEPGPQHDYGVFRKRIAVPVGRDLRSMLLGKRTIIRHLRRAVRTHRIDLVHAHNGPDNLGAWAIRKAGVPVLHDIHDLQSAAPILFSRPSLRPLIHRLYRRWEGIVATEAAALLVPSAHMKQHLEEQYRTTRVEVVENKALPGEVRHLPKRSEQDGQVHAVYAGAFTLTPGSERAFLPPIEALSGSRIHTHIYPIVFDDHEREELKRRVARLPNVHYHDPVPHARLIEELSQYDYGLVHFPVMTDNLRMASATKLYEYLLAGLPVIANPDGRIGAFVREHGCGITVERLEEARAVLEAPARDYVLPVEEAVLDGQAFLRLYREILATVRTT